MIDDCYTVQYWFQPVKILQFWLYFKKSLRLIVSGTTQVRWPGYVLPSCSCKINRLFVNSRMAKRSLTRFQVHKSLRQLGKKSKVNDNKPLRTYSFMEPLAVFQIEVLEIVHTQAFLPKDYWELAQAGFYYKVLSSSFSHSFCLAVWNL